MIDNGIVRSTEKPEPKVMDEYHVYINTNITTYEEDLEEGLIKGYEYHQIQYDKDEYIQLISDKNSELENQITDIQLALCEIYEGVSTNG